MDGICNILGARTIRLTIQGRVYTLTPMTLSEYAERESIIIGMKTDPRKLIAWLPECWPVTDRNHAVDVANSIVDTSLRRASAADVAKFDESFQGLVWRFSRALRKHHTGIANTERATALLEQAGKSQWVEIVKALLLVEERDLLTKVFFPGSTESENRRVPWAVLLRGLSERYGWTWESIGNLTLYQALAALGGKVPEDGAFSVDDQHLAGFREWQSRRKLFQTGF